MYNWFYIFTWCKYVNVIIDMYRVSSDPIYTYISLYFSSDLKNPIFGANFGQKTYIYLYFSTCHPIFQHFSFFNVIWKWKPTIGLQSCYKKFLASLRSACISNYTSYFPMYHDQTQWLSLMETLDRGPISVTLDFKCRYFSLSVISSC